MKGKLNKKELAAIISLSNRISKLLSHYKENDIYLSNSSNVTIYTNLGAALVSIDTILQEYI